MGTYGSKKILDQWELHREQGNAPDEGARPHRGLLRANIRACGLNPKSNGEPSKGFKEVRGKI